MFLVKLSDIILSSISKRLVNIELIIFRIVDILKRIKKFILFVVLLLFARYFDDLIKIMLVLVERVLCQVKLLVEEINRCSAASCVVE
jgi:hypothetical protein